MKTIEERAKEYAYFNMRDLEIDIDEAESFVENAYKDGAQSEHEELTSWNSPECPPEDGKTVIVKYLHRGSELYSIGDYDKKYGWSTQDEVGFSKDNIIGWREIHE